jgi:mannitol/fructose-specific phosphotransferase system IIA component (Ntr-type)
MASIAAQLLQPARISLELAARDKNEAIVEVASIMQRDADLLDYERFCKELIERDEMRSTAAGYGVAFPHARTDAVREIIVAAGRTARGVKFGDEIVNFIFVIGTPREKASEYLVVVGTLARLLRKEKTRAGLLAAETPEDFIRVLTV